MSLLSFGAKNAQGNTWSTQSAASEDKSTSVSSGRSSSDQLSQGQSNEAVAYGDIYAALYGGAAGAADRASANAGIFQNEAAMLFSGGTSFLDQLQGGGAADDYLKGRVSGNDDVLNRQIEDLRANLGENFSESILPGIRSSAVQGGTFGGGRQGVAEGIAGRDVNRAFGQGVTSLMTADRAARDSAAVSLGGLETDRARTGLGALPDLLGIAGAGANAELTPYTILSGIYGGPTTLTSSFDYSKGTSRDATDAFTYSSGSSYAEGESRGKTSDKGFDFSII